MFQGQALKWRHLIPSLHSVTAFLSQSVSHSMPKTCPHLVDTTPAQAQNWSFEPSWTLSIRLGATFLGLLVKNHIPFGKFTSGQQNPKPLLLPSQHSSFCDVSQTCLVLLKCHRYLFRVNRDLLKSIWTSSRFSKSLEDVFRHPYYTTTKQPARHVKGWKQRAYCLYIALHSFSSWAWRWAWFKVINCLFHSWHQQPRMLIQSMMW